jgi:hypothetical protein
MREVEDIQARLTNTDCFVAFAMKIGDIYVT